jgi:hypothetical protein
MSRRQQDADDDRRVAYVDLMQRSGVTWVDDRAPTPGAALAFYSSFIGAAADHRYRGCRRSVRRQMPRAAIVGQVAGLVGAARCGGHSGIAEGCARRP